MELNELKFDAHGLIPAVVQDFRTRQVLTLAYMNRESLEITPEDIRAELASRHVIDHKVKQETMQ